MTVSNTESPTELNITYWGKSIFWGMEIPNGSCLRRAHTLIPGIVERRARLGNPTGLNLHFWAGTGSDDEMDGRFGGVDRKAMVRRDLDKNPNWG